MDALDVETSIAEGEQALQALMPFAMAYAGKREAHEAEKGIFKRVGGDEDLLRATRDGRRRTGDHAG